MKSLLFFAGLMLTSSAFATTTLCQNGPLSFYLAPAFSCQAGSLTLSGFGYQGTGPDASSITLTPGTSVDKEGFQLTGNWSAQSQTGVSVSEDSQITYTVSKVGGLIDTLSLSFQSIIVGTGIATVSDRFCVSTLSYYCPQSEEGLVSVTNPGAGFSNKAFFAGVSSIAVTTGINVISGVNGSAGITSINGSFSSPEPLSFVLLGTGLVGIALMRRRLYRR